MEFAAALLAVHTPDRQAPEPFRVDVMVCTAERDSLVLSRSIQTTYPLPLHLRLLNSAGSDPDGPPLSPEQAAAQIRDAVGGRLLVVGGVDSAALLLEQTFGPLEATCIDLYELASLVFLRLESARLPDLAKAAGVAPVPGHSANDVHLIATAYRAICARVTSLDPLVLEEIARESANSTWPLRYFFREMAALRFTPSGLASDRERPHSTERPSATLKALVPLASRRSVDRSEVVDCLEKAVASVADRLESRPQQTQMAAAVCAAIEGDYHLLVEAGTGTGKSLAYLVPAALHALRNDERIVISTNTINLQQQLIEKDLPQLRSLVGRYGPTDLQPRAASLRFEPLKGRRNYLCLQRFALMRRAADASDVETRFITRILLWQAAGGGDRGGLRLPPEEEPLWSRVCAEGSGCLTPTNPFVRDGTCQLLQARRRAEAAHLLVVNHALLLSDLAAGGRVLPPYERLVIDEAHNLEDEATAQFGFQAGEGDVTLLLDSIYARGRDRESGLVVDVRMATWARQASGDGAFLAALLSDLTERVTAARARIPDTFAVLRRFVDSQKTEDSDYDTRLLVTAATRSQPEWQDVELAWENLRLALRHLEDGLARMTTALVELPDDDAGDRDVLAIATDAAQVAAQRLREGIEGVVNHGDPDTITWLTVNRRSGSISFSSAPLTVAGILDAGLFAQKASVILTSATLTAGGRFTYVQERLGLQEAETLALGSPFDYQRAALVLTPSDLPEPAQRTYQRAVEQAVVSLCQASRGRALVLFTSHGALRATAQAIRGPLAAAGIRTLAQSIDGSPQALIERLRSNPESVVLGTSSFWEGVDVVGETLSLLIVAKLPFAVPSDPVVRARSELFDDAFREFSLPQAVLRFKQGFGRLIRHRGDRGVFVILDRRARSKSYGRMFLQSLPDCTLREASTPECASLVLDWLGHDESESAYADIAPVARRPFGK